MPRLLGGSGAVGGGQWGGKGEPSCGKKVFFLRLFSTRFLPNNAAGAVN